MPEINLTDNKIIKGLLARSGTILCFLIILVNVIYNFVAKIDLTVSVMLSVTAEAAVYVVSAAALFLLCKESGTQEGRRTEAYKTAMAAYKTVREAVTCRVRELTEWCIEYTKEEQRNRREEILAPNDIRYEEYEQTYKGLSARELKKLPLLPWQRRAIVQANRVRPYRVTARKLLTGHSVHASHAHAMHPRTEEAIETSAKLSKTAICALFLVNAAFAVAFETNIAVIVVKVLFRAIMLIYACFSGYSTGYRIQSVTAVAYTNEQTELLTLFRSTLA